MISNPAPYLRWAKTRPRVSCDLAASGLQPVTTGELLGDARARDVFELTGSNDEGLPALSDAIAARYHLPVECVSLAHAAAGANFLAMMALLEPGDDVLIERPVYDPLIAAARANGATVRHFTRDARRAFALEAAAVRTAMTAKTRLIVLSNAHNPTGQLADAHQLDAIGELARDAGAHVLIDEVYLEAQHDATPVPVPSAARGDVFISTNSLTKAYGLAGLKSGWVLSSPAIAERIRRAHDVVDGSGPFPTERLAVEAIRRIDQLRARARAILAANLAALDEMARNHPRLEWLAPQAGTTAFPRVRGVRDTSALVDYLINAHDTVVVPGHFFQAPDRIRISFGARPEAFEAAVKRLDRALREFSPAEEATDAGSSN